ncbi:hypothetical protein BC629DRAFT_1445549 [Irpex lacteus]|nr:hypothetical protein BC629DRAFT_1445549 [Irpex lacteus]
MFQGLDNLRVMRTTVRAGTAWTGTLSKSKPGSQQGIEAERQELPGALNEVQIEGSSAQGEPSSLSIYSTAMASESHTPPPILSRYRRTRRFPTLGMELESDATLPNKKKITTTKSSNCTMLTSLLTVVCLCAISGAVSGTRHCLRSSRSQILLPRWAIATDQPRGDMAIAEDLGANEDGLQEQEDKEDDDPEQEEYGYGTSDDDEGDEDNDDKQGNHTGATEPGGESGCEENWDIEDEHGDIDSLYNYNCKSRQKQRNWYLELNNDDIGGYRVINEHHKEVS